MKIKSELRKVTCTQKAMAAALGLTPARINQLIDEDVMVADESDRNNGLFLFDSLRNYFLSNKASGEGVNYWKEKGLHEQAKRKTAELNLRKLEGTIYDAQDVEDTFITLLSVVRNSLSLMPQKLSARLEGLSATEIYAILNSEVEETLTELANFDVKSFGDDDVTR